MVLAILAASVVIAFAAWLFGEGQKQQRVPFRRLLQGAAISALVLAGFLVNVGSQISRAAGATSTAAMAAQSPPISPEDLMKGMSGAGSMVAYNDAIANLGDHPTQSDYCKVARSATTAWYDIRLSRMMGMAGIFDLELQDKLGRTRQHLNPPEFKVVDMFALQMEERVAYYNSLCAHP